MFGTTQLYVFVNPKERDSSGEKYEVPSFEMAQEEIAASSGFDMNTDNKSQGMWYNGSEQQILGSLTFPMLELLWSKHEDAKIFDNQISESFLMNTNMP